jgi:hypothetical protein
MDTIRSQIRLTVDPVPRPRRDPGGDLQIEPNLPLRRRDAKVCGTGEGLRFGVNSEGQAGPGGKEKPCRTMALQFEANRMAEPWEPR